MAVSPSGKAAISSPPERKVPTAVPSASSLPNLESCVRTNRTSPSGGVLAQRLLAVRDR